MKGCPKCGRMLNGNVEICPFCNYDFKEIEGFFQKINEEKFLNEEKYAGFIKRAVAGMLDIEIIAIIISLFFILMSQFNMKNIWLMLVIGLIIYIIENTLLERTKWHGSLGKKIIGIEVFDKYENPETIGIAFKRNIIKLVNLLTLGIGFLMCVSPPKRQTLGDKLSNTYVLSKVTFAEEKDKGYASASKRLLAFIIDVIMIAIISYGLIYIHNYLNKNVEFYSKIFHDNTIKIIIILLTTLLYFPMSERRRGRSIGKKYLKIRVTNYNEEAVGFLKSLVRVLLIPFDILTLGFLLPLSDKKKQTLKDKITKTMVIDY